MAPAAPLAPEDVADRLREAGLRVTAPRLATYAAVVGAGHLAADAVSATVRDRLGTVSTQTVYDALAVLCELDLLRRIQPAHSPALFEARVADDHHHVVCRACGAVADVDCDPGSTPSLAAADAHGFVVDEAEVTFWGTCPACADPSSPDPRPED